MTTTLMSLETLIYYVCLICIIVKIEKYKIKRKSLLFFNCFLIGVLILLSFRIEYSVFLYICALVQITQLILICFAIEGVKFFSIVGIYGLLYSINSIIISSLNCVVVLNDKTTSIIEFIIHIAITAFYLCCCFNTTIRYKIQQILITLPTKIKVLTILSFCISAGLMVVIISNPEIYVVSLWSSAVRISLVFFALFVCTTFPILIITVLTNTYLKKQNERFERELEAQAKHYVALSESNKELRRFRHDFKNLRIGMVTLINSGDSQLALKMIEDGQRSFIEATDRIVKFDTGNGIVDAILSEKQTKANFVNANIIFDGAIPSTAFSPTDLCVIFGNTLDNAIEACEKISKNTVKTIAVSVQCNGGFGFISISNPVSEKVIVKNNIVETTKQDRTSHGYGLYSLRKLAEKYDGEMKLHSEDNLFTINLDLCLTCT